MILLGDLVGPRPRMRAVAECRSTAAAG